MSAVSIQCHKIFHERGILSYYITIALEINVASFPFVGIHMYGFLSGVERYVYHAHSTDLKNSLFNLIMLYAAME